MKKKDKSRKQVTKEVYGFRQGFHHGDAKLEKHFDSLHHQEYFKRGKSKNIGQDFALTRRNGHSDHRKRLDRIVFLFVVMGLAMVGRRALPAQEMTNKFVHVSIREGLSQGSALSILQDRKGFIWIGSEEGLNRYDGYYFKVYRPTANPNSISDNTCWTLFEDSHGDIWVGTLRGLNRYNRDRDNFTRFLYNPNDPQSLSNNAVHSISEDRAGTLWVGTEDGLNAFDRKTGKFTRFIHEPNRRPSSSQTAIYSIYEDKSGLIWMATYRGLHAFDPKTGKTQRYVYDPRNPQSLSHNQVQTIFEDRNGTLWVGTNGGGLNVLNRKTGAFTRYRHRYGDPHSLSNDSVYAILQDRAGRLLVGTLKGLNIFDPQQKSFSVIRNDPSNPESLSYDYVVSLCEDKTGVLWVGTRGKGINKFVPDKLKFSHYKTLPNDPQNLVSSFIRSIAEDASGNLWIATEDRGLDYWDRTSGRHTHFQYDPQNPAGLNCDFVYTLQIDKSGILWIGTLGGGLNRYNPKTKSFSHYVHNPNDPGSLSQNSVRGLCLDHLGTLWVGTEGGGLNKFIPAQNAFIRYQNDPALPGSLSHDTARILYEDRSGTLWVGTFGGGLNKLDREKETFVRYRHDDADPNSLSNDFIMSLNEDNEGNLWVGTEGGINRFNPKIGTFRCYSTKDGLPNDTIYGILPDDTDNIWISSNRGLARLNPRTGEVKTYDAADGLQGNEFNGGAYFKTKAGEMFFGGTNGLNSFFPEKIKDNPYPPAVVITDFQIFNKPVPVGEKVNGKVVLEKSITETTDLVLSWRDRIVSFEFVALHYTAPEKNQYAYIMEGLEKEWNYVKDRRFASYTNLLPGRYTFRVKASNNDGVWNGEGVALRIRVVPPLWKTWWFRGFAVLALGLFIGAVVRWRVRTLKEKATLLERKVQERTAELHRENVVRKKVEEELERRQKYLETVLFRAPSAIVVTDAQSKVVEWSPGAEKIFGRRREEVLGKEVDDIVTRPDLREEARRLTKITMSGGQVSPREAVRYHKDGTPINVLVAGSPLYIGDGFAGSIAVYTDITERKRAEEELSKHREHLEELVKARTEELEKAKIAADAANRAKSVFLANMSHEIRTPMNAILGFSQLMRQDDTLNPRQRKHLDTINRSGEHLMALINDVLEMSKIEAGRTTLNSTTFDLRALLEDLEMMFRVRTDAKKLNFAVEGLGHIPDYVVGDQGKLLQVFINLLGNAVKFTEKGGILLRVRVNQEGSNRLRLQAEVEDTGPGIPETELNNLFKPFQQTQNSRRAGSGTGLGLAISKAFVGLMGGDITVGSKDGTGCLIKFDVQLGESEAGSDKKKPESARVRGLRPGQPTYRILIADDEDTNLMLISQMLGNIGFETRQATNGEEAVETFKAWQPHLIFMDMRMPVMDGYEAIRRIRAGAGGRDVKIVSISASAFEQNRQEALRAGADDFMAKPFREAVLFEMIGKFLGVEYVFSDETGPAKLLPGAAVMSAITAEILSVLPEESVNKMRDAVINADFDLMMELVGGVEDHNILVAQELRSLIERFEYTEFLELLQTGRYAR
jgi:PAS domain S-box-containing protein